MSAVWTAQHRTTEPEHPPNPVVMRSRDGWAVIDLNTGNELFHAKTLEATLRYWRRP